jgi:hypothetical protein
MEMAAGKDNPYFVTAIIQRGVSLLTLYAWAVEISIGVSMNP